MGPSKSHLTTPFFFFFLEDPSILLCVNDIAKKISVLEAFHLFSESWKNVGEGTIWNCFQRGGSCQKDLTKILTKGQNFGKFCDKFNRRN